MDKGIAVVPIQRRASWARRMVPGIDNVPYVAPELAQPTPAINTYNLTVTIDMAHAPHLALVAQIRRRLEDLNPRGIELK